MRERLPGCIDRDGCTAALEPRTWRWAHEELTERATQLIRSLSGVWGGLLPVIGAP
jgi:hypothetical protein